MLNIHDLSFSVFTSSGLYYYIVHHQVCPTIDTVVTHRARLANKHLLLTQLSYMETRGMFFNDSEQTETWWQASGLMTHGIFVLEVKYLQ